MTEQPIIETLMGKCCYKNYENEATTNGIVFMRNPEGGKNIPAPVQACDKHKKESSFFES
ncbi:hypothetical protein EEL32_12295 [Brevibacillus laterosporus]|uniref:Uncharacterized protein n=1 Tax=Brevibacillus laterosporus TaxID=1465 RepID=A0A502IJ61_BRELA|nr:hypothetical protein [Brevibacillus laterosporus]QDX93181.1 hypothetical protein EEL30_13225 [Brevibacillus laterosporus]TPG86877.1 hypothetical protein EEL32_12295 [Brevibacillus laterosporus]